MHYDHYLYGDCGTTAQRLVFLEGKVASAASYPAWGVMEGARPKVLVFLPLNHRFLREIVFKINAHAHQFALVARIFAHFKIHWQFRRLTSYPRQQPPQT